MCSGLLVNLAKGGTLQLTTLETVPGFGYEYTHWCVKLMEIKSCKVIPSQRVFS